VPGVSRLASVPGGCRGDRGLLGRRWGDGLGCRRRRGRGDGRYRLFRLRRRRRRSRFAAPQQGDALDRHPLESGGRHRHVTDGGDEVLRVNDSTVAIRHDPRLAVDSLTGAQASDSDGAEDLAVAQTEGHTAVPGDHAGHPQHRSVRVELGDAGPFGGRTGFDDGLAGGGWIAVVAGGEKDGDKNEERFHEYSTRDEPRALCVRIRRVPDV